MTESMDDDDDDDKSVSADAVASVCFFELHSQNIIYTPEISQDTNNIDNQLDATITVY